MGEERAETMTGSPYCKTQVMQSNKAELFDEGISFRGKVSQN